MRPIAIETHELRQLCARDQTSGADPVVTMLRRRYLHLLESEPAPSPELRRDIRRDLLRSASSDTWATVVALLLAAAAVLALLAELRHLVPALADPVAFGLQAGLLLTVPAIAVTEATRWRSATRSSAQRELDALLPPL